MDRCLGVYIAPDGTRRFINDHFDLDDVTSRLKNKGYVLRNAQLDIGAEDLIGMGFYEYIEFEYDATMFMAEALRDAGYRDMVVQLHLQDELTRSHVQIQGHPKVAKQAAEYAAAAFKEWIKETKRIKEQRAGRKSEQKSERGFYQLPEVLSERDINMINEAIRIAEAMSVTTAADAVEAAEAIDADALIAEAEKTMKRVRTRVR